MHRFFIDPADLESAGGGGSRVIFHPDQVRQMKRVLRLRPGDSVAAVLPGREIVVRLEGGGSGELSGGGPVMEDRPGLPLAPIAVDLYQALAKGDRFESVLQKGTELGVARVVPVLTDRTVARPDPERVQGRVVRWRAVAREAAEQCGRSDEPVIEAPADWAGVCAEAGRADLAVVPWEREEATALVEVLRAFAGRLGGLADGGRAAVQPAVGPVARPRVAVIIGPEGGLTAAEVAAADRCGIKPVSLGPRILRTDTAAVAALTMVLYELGDLGRRPSGRPSGGLPGMDEVE